MKLKKTLIFLLLTFITFSSFYQAYALDDIASPDLETSPMISDDDSSVSDTEPMDTEPNINEEEKQPSEDSFEWLNVSNVKFAIEKTGNSSNGFSHHLTITGLPTDFSTRSLYLLVANSPTLPTTDLENPSNSKNKVSLNISATSSMSAIIDSYVEKNGDIYVWLLEAHKNTESKVLVSAQKVERASLNPIGDRLQLYFFPTHTSAFIKEFTPNVNGRKLHIKVGNITDKEILKGIRDQKSGSFTALLNYAKTASSFHDSSFSVKYSSDSSIGALTSSWPLAQYQFYYVYMYLEDENGTYYPLEDVGLYQAQINDSGKSLCDYYSNKNKFVWDLGDETPDEEKPSPTPTPTPKPTPTPLPSTDNTVANTVLPNTGIDTLFMIIVFVIISILVFSYIKTKELKDIK